MNKNFNILILAIIICLGVTSCSNSNKTSESTETTQPPFIIEGGGIIGEDGEFDFNQSTEAYVEDDQTYLNFKEGLDNLGMVYTEIPVAGDLIGAQKAIRYQFDNDTLIEVYKFDENSDAFKLVEKNKEVTIEGAGSAPVDEVSGNLALYIEGDIKNKKEIIELFKSLKDK